MSKSTTKIIPPSAEEIEAVRQELYDKLEIAENQPLSVKRNAEIVFAEKREMLEGLLIARI